MDENQHLTSEAGGQVQSRHLGDTGSPKRTPVPKCIALAPPVVSRMHSVESFHSLDGNKTVHKLLLVTGTWCSVSWPQEWNNHNGPQHRASGTHLSAALVSRASLDSPDQITWKT